MVGENLLICLKVRIEGKVEKLSDKESEDYFKTRPRPSQISCAASNQSQPIASKTVSVMDFVTSII